MKWLWILVNAISIVSADMRFLNLYGIETDLMDCQCSFRNTCEYYMDYSKALGFNGFRIPFSAEYVKRGDFTSLDRIIEKAGSINTTLMLDYHRTYSSHQGNWYETNKQDFLSIWRKVLNRYNDKPIVQYIDLYNEFQDGPDKALFWNELMTSVIDQLEGEFPDRFNWIVGATNWGGNLHGIHIDLPLDNIYYTIHKYSFSHPLTGNYRTDWDYSFNNIPPERLIVGEFGWITENPEQVKWAKEFLSYLKEKGYRNTCFWTLALSGDTNGILRDDCIELDEKKITMLQDFWKQEHRQLNYSGVIVFKKKKLLRNKDGNKSRIKTTTEPSDPRGTKNTNGR